MKIFTNILKKFHSQKGITGTDVSIAIIIISVTIGVITGIYINVTNSSKENIRYSAATRIATQIAENIEAMSYDELESETILQIDSNTEDGVERKVLNVIIPKGYIVEVTKSLVDSDLDIIKKYNIEVSYRVGKKNYDNVSVQIIKQRELLEQTNQPDLSLLQNYNKTKKYFYPIKMISGEYIITSSSDKDWYNYDIGNYANVYASNVKKQIGDIVTPKFVEELYVWVPRFGKIEDSQLNDENITFLYGTSKHRIMFKNLDVSKNFYSYTVDYSDGNYNDALVYVENTFRDNDGLTGMWYAVGSTNENNVENSYNALTSIIPKQN